MKLRLYWPMSLRPRARLWCAVAIAAVMAGRGCAGPASGQDKQDKMEAPAEIIAVQIRKQGFACEKAQSAVRDREASTPNAAVWILRCKNASYRVRLIPDMAAQVERIE